MKRDPFRRSFFPLLLPLLLALGLACLAACSSAAADPPPDHGAILQLADRVEHQQAPTGQEVATAAMPEQAPAVQVPEPPTGEPDPAPPLARAPHGQLLPMSEQMREVEADHYDCMAAIKLYEGGVSGLNDGNFCRKLELQRSAARISAISPSNPSSPTPDPKARAGI